MDNDIYYHPPMADNPIRKKEPGLTLSKRDLIFALIFFAVSFLIVDFVFFHGFNSGFTIAFSALLIALTAYLFDRRNRASVFSCVCGAMSLAGAVTFSLYKDTLINTIMVFLVCALFGIYICSVSGIFTYNEGSWKMLGDVLKSVFVSPFSSASEITGAYGRAMSKNKISKNVIIGILLSLPVLLVIIPLLVSSDAAFENLIKMILKNIGVYLLEIVIAVIVAPFVILYAVSKKYNKKIAAPAKANTGRGVIQRPVTVSFLSVISVTYMVYLFSQLAYFFSAFSGILPEGYTYTASVYARRGFFEMFAICVINMIIIALANMLTKRIKGKISVAVKLLSTFILAFTVLILITAMQKMKLNIEIFGLSRNRLLVSVFMLMIMIIIVFYIVHIFLPKVSYMQPIILICSAMFISLSFGDIDSAVARYNVTAYEQGELESIDVLYLGDLADSAVPYIIRLADDEQLSSQANYVLMKKMLYSDCIYDDGTQYVYEKPNFRNYNLSSDRACKQLCDYLNTDSFKEYITQYEDETEKYDYYEYKDKEENMPLLNGLGENTTVYYNDKVYNFLVKNEYGNEKLLYETSSYIQSSIRVKGKEVDVLKLADDYYGNFLCVRGEDSADYIYTCLDMTYDDFCSMCEPENITSYKIRSYGRDEFYGESSTIINAINRIYADDSIARKTNEDYQNLDSSFYITFYYNHMPITIKNTAAICLSSSGDNYYVDYFPDDMSSEHYAVNNEKMKALLWNYFIEE